MLLLVRDSLSLKMVGLGWLLLGAYECALLMYKVYILN